MTLEQIKDLVLVLAAGISAIGIPTLIALIWRFHKAQVDALKLYTFKEVETQISALENSYVRVNQRLREYVAELEKQKIDVPLQEIEQRLKLLREAITELNQLGFAKIERKQGNYMRRLIGLSNYDHMVRVRGLLDTLIGIETRLTKQLGPDVIHREKQNPNTDSQEETT